MDLFSLLSLLIKLIFPPIITAILGFASKFWPRFSLFKKRKSRAIEDYEFLQCFFQIDIKDRSRLEVEQAIRAWRGEKFRYMDIIALLGFPNPSLAFSLFKHSSRYFVLDKSGVYVYKVLYALDTKRKWKVRGWIATYFISAMVALYPIWAVVVLHAQAMAWISISVPFLFMFGGLAITALNEGESLSKSSKLLLEQSLIEPARIQSE